MSPGQRRGRPRQDGPDLAATRDTHDRTGCLRQRAALALAMRSAGSPPRLVWAMAGRDADRLAAEIEGYEKAMAHLAECGQTGIEPYYYGSVRRMSRRWWCSWQAMRRATSPARRCM